MGIDAATYPRPFVRSPRLFQCLCVLELVHISSQLFHVLLKLAILPQLVPEDLDEGLERRLGRFGLPPRGAMEASVLGSECRCYPEWRGKRECSWRERVPGAQGVARNEALEVSGEHGGRRREVPANYSGDASLDLTSAGTPSTQKNSVTWAQIHP